MRRYLAFFAGICAFAVGCSAPPPAPRPGSPVAGSPALNTALTCAEFNANGKESAGFQILWLEGNYSGRAKNATIPAGWIKTVAQSVGGNCAMPLNASRTVFDILAQTHRDYGAAARAAARQPDASEDTSPAIGTAATCGQLGALFRSGDKRGGGFTVLWLEGYYSGRTGVSAIPADWITNVSQGIGAGCAIDANASRPVIDIVAQIHRDHGGAAGVR